MELSSVGQDPRHCRAGPAVGSDRRFGRVVLRLVGLEEPPRAGEDGAATKIAVGLGCRRKEAVEQ